MPKITGNNAGMTLLELTIATGIMTVALAMSFGGVLSMVSVGRLSEEQEIATTHLATVMEELRTCNIEDIIAYEPPYLEGLGEEVYVALEYVNEEGNVVALPAAAGSEGEGEGEGEDGVGAVDPASLPNPLELRVEITWLGERGREYSMDASAIFGR